MSAIAEHLSIRRVKSLEVERAKRRAARPWRAGPPAAVLHAVAAVHRALYWWSGGRMGSRVRGRPVLLLTTRGRRSGKERTTPVCFLVAGDRLVLAAAAGGRSRHPAWYLNLQACPHVAVRLGARRLMMVARVAQGAERAHLWNRLCRHYPICARYEKRSRREIPVVVLRPADRRAVTDAAPRGGER